MANSYDTAEAEVETGENPVYGYITTEANAYRTNKVYLSDNWAWSMYEHIRRSFLYKNSQFSEGENDGNRPFNNIVRPILNVQYRAEGFDSKDIVPFVDDADNFDKSFFVKKYADKWAAENGLDDFIDAMIESYIDYGLTVVEDIGDKAPINTALERIEFCDQTDFESGSVCELYTMGIDELLDMAEQGSWSSKAVSKVIKKAETGKMSVYSPSQTTFTPSKTVEIHKLRGVFPETWLNNYDTYEGEEARDENEEPEYTDKYKYVRQLHIVAYYYDDDNNKCGITLFSGADKKKRYKVKKRDPIFGRACGFGGVEELFDPQQWTNMSEIQQQEMLEFASMVLLQTADENFRGKNVREEKEKGEILIHDDNKPLSMVDTKPQNIDLFSKAVEKWNLAAQSIGSANEALLGQSPAAGTPFSLQALVVQQGFGLHDYRKGKLAIFMGEIYREWILPRLVADMKKGHKWLDDLSLEEMQALAENAINLQAWDVIKRYMFEGSLPTQQQIDMFKEQAREAFMQGGGKKFLELIENEIDQIPVAVQVDVAGKQYDLHDRVEKLTNIFRQILANPQMLQLPGMAKLFNEIIEESGFSPVDFSGLTKIQPPAPVPGAPVESPIQPQNINPQQTVTA